MCIATDKILDVKDILLLEIINSTIAYTHWPNALQFLYLHSIAFFAPYEFFFYMLHIQHLSQILIPANHMNCQME